MPDRSLTTDHHGLPVTHAGAAARDGYAAALTQLNLYRGDPLATIDAVLAEAPDFLMGHAFRAALFVTAPEGAAWPELRRTIEGARALAAQGTEREWAHFAAATAWMEGDFAEGARRYGAIAAQWPRDLLALQVAHVCDFFLGQREGLRDRPRAALPAWNATEPGRGIVEGMLAFGLEECGDYAAAEAAGRRAVAAEPRDAWAIHAVAHVMEMQGRAVEGAEWLGQRVPDWEGGTLLAVHNFWHLALFHLERGEQAKALAVFDRGVRRHAPAPAIELVDVSAMLWRFLLCGIPVAERFAEASDAWAAQAPGVYAFNDAHAVMAHLGAGRREEALRVIVAMQVAAQDAGTNAMMTRDVGLPLAHGLVAFADGRYAEAARLLGPLPAIAHRFGGSHAQRDVIAFTRAEAALRAGDSGLATALAGERLRAKPDSPLARAMAGRAGTLPGAA